MNQNKYLFTKHFDGVFIILLITMNSNIVKKKFFDCGQFQDDGEKSQYGDLISTIFKSNTL